MAFADWFRPKWRHSNPAVRAVAVKALTDPAKLGRVAKGDVDASVRRVAVELLSDQTVLGEVAKGNDDAELRKAATLRVTDRAVLAEIVMKDPDLRVRQVAIPRVTDTAVLGEIVKKETDASLRQFAIDRVDVSQVTDELVLGEVAKRHQGLASRKSATVRISDAPLLMEIANGTDDKQLRELALRRVTDQSLLATTVIEGGSHALAILKLITDVTQLGRIAKTAKDKEWREKAVARIEDEAVLAEVANSAPEASVRAEAGKRLPPARWKDLLAILNAKKPAVLAANPSLLAEIACKAIDEEARSAAVKRLADSAVLAQVAEKDASESVRRDAKQRIAILECEQRAAQGNATGEDLCDMARYCQLEDPRKAIGHLSDAIGRAAWLQGIAWQDRVAIYETRAAAYLATRQYDPAITDYDQAIEECKEPGSEFQVLRKRSSCYKEMGMEEQAQEDRAAAAKAQEVYEAGRRAKP